MLRMRRLNDLFIYKQKDNNNNKGCAYCGKGQTRPLHQGLVYVYKPVENFLVVRELFTIGIDANCSTLHEFVELGQLARRRFQSHSQFFQLSA